MEIHVEGEALEYVSPDQVILNIEFKKKGESYNAVLNEGIESVKTFIEQILIPNSIDKEELKTRNFTIEEDKKYNNKLKKYEKVGFLFNQEAVLRFDYDKILLAAIMISLSNLKNPPLCYVEFGLKDKKEVQKNILFKAYEDAKIKPEAIAIASKKKLKDCIKTEIFKKSNSKFISNFAIEEGIFNSSLEVQTKNIINTLIPEDIKLSEKLYCLWIAE